jgi:hypothetical protein
MTSNGVSVSKTAVTSTTPAVEPTPVQATVPNSAPPVQEKKGGFGWGKCFLVGCVVVFLCCVCTIVFALVAPNLLVKTVVGSNRAPDASLTRLTSLTEFVQLEANQLDDGMESFITANETTGDAQILMKEKDIITLFLTGMGINSSQNTATAENIQKIGVKLTPNKAVFEMDLGLLAPLLASSPDMQNFDPKTFDGINFSITLSVASDNKTVVLDNFSTGNTFIDSIIPAELKASILDSVQTSIEESLSNSESSDVQITKIEIRQGELMIALKVNVATP